MTTNFKNQEFRSWYDNGNQVFSGLAFERCRFTSCRLSLARDPRQRSTVRGCTVSGCETRGCAIGAAVVEDVSVQDLKTNGLLQAWGAVFKHVVFRGKIDRVMFSPAVSAGRAEPEEQRAFDVANAAYYSSTDWALDIRDAKFAECEIQRVPAHLVLRDAATQVVVKRAKALQGTWRKLDLSRTYWATSIEFFLNRGDPDVVLVAPKRHPEFAQLLDGLRRLRDSGVAEPD